LGELTSLFQLGKSLHMDLPVQTVLEIIVRRVASALHAHEADLYVLSRETRSLHCRASFGVAARAPEAEVPYGAGPVGTCARLREAILLVAGAPPSPFPEFFESNAETGSAIFLPLVVESRLVGVLQISRAASGEPFRGEHLEFATTFANGVAPAISGAMAAVTLRKTTTTTATGPPPPGESAAGSFQDVLLSAAAQELKAPLTSIVGYAEVLGQNDRRLTPALRAEFTVRLSTEAHRMMAVVDEILDAIRLDLGRYLLEVQVANPNDVVKRAVGSVESLAADRRVTLRLSLDDAIGDEHLDPTKLGQSVVHLLRAGVRFSPAEEGLTVSTLLGDGTMRIEVRGTCASPDEKSIAELFELAPSARGERTPEAIGGGFGPHLAKRFVELNGGAVGADATEGDGFLLWIELPWGEGVTSLVGENPFTRDIAGL